MSPEDITAGCRVELACGWVVGPVKSYTRVSSITNHELDIERSAWNADNYSCGYNLSWTSDGKHVGNPNKIDHPLHIVRVVETEEKLDGADRLKLEMYDKAMDARPLQCRGMNLEATIKTLSRFPVKPVPPKEVFLKVQETDDSTTYGAIFQLPDDGCPGEGRFLRIRVEVPEDGRSQIEVRLSVLEQNGSSHKLGSLHTQALACIANLLYPAAGLQTTQRIVQRIVQRT